MMPRATSVFLVLLRTSLARHAGIAQSDKTLPMPPVVELIHVAKTAGASIGAVLRRACKRTATCRVRATHMEPYRLPNTSVAAIIVALRDPVTRVVSAFNWRHPMLGGHAIRARPVPENQHANQLEVALYQCFGADVDAFAKALWDRSFCGLVARRNLMEPVAHLGAGLHFHLQEVALGGMERWVRAAPIFVIRFESMRSDLDCVLRHVVPGVDLPSRLPLLHSQSRGSKNTTAALSIAGRQRLESLLASEYFLASELERRAVRCS